MRKYSNASSIMSENHDWGAGDKTIFRGAEPWGKELLQTGSEEIRSPPEAASAVETISIRSVPGPWRMGGPILAWGSRILACSHGAGSV